MSTPDSLEQLIVPREYGPPSEERLSRVAFVLSSPRSGSTLLRTMLSGHPRLFAPPELRLLSKDGPGRPLPTGVPEVSTVSSILSGLRVDVDQATVEEMPPEEVYALIQRAAGGRLLVDKTPHYAVDAAVLRRAEELFDRPLYIWLTRHPCGVVSSFREIHPAFFWGWQAVGMPTDLRAEQTWRLCNYNIRDFVSGLGERAHVVRYEDLISSPGQTMRGLCEFLGVELHEKVFNPFDNDEARMLGYFAGDDPRFHTRSAIDTSLVDSWKGIIDPTTFDDETKSLARRLGYTV